MRSERVLAPATLYFGRHRMCWLCRSASHPCTFVRHDKSSVGPLEPHNLWLGMRDLSSLSDLDSLSAWWSIVTNYSARRITKPSDRLPAVAGLVEKFLRRWPDSRYKYGIWSHAMLPDLLWRRKPATAYFRTTHAGEDSRRVVVSHSEEGRDDLHTTGRKRFAPSWSWASVYDAISYDWDVVLAPESERPDGQQVVLSHGEVGSAGGFLQGSWCGGAVAVF